VVYWSDDGPKNVPELATVVINCVVDDGTPLDTFIPNLISKTLIILRDET
jgi:hypothetical protein